MNSSPQVNSVSARPKSLLGLNTLYEWVNFHSRLVIQKEWQCLKVTDQNLSEVNIVHTL